MDPEVEGVGLVFSTHLSTCLGREGERNMRMVGGKLWVDGTSKVEVGYGLCHQHPLAYIMYYTYMCP